MLERATACLKSGAARDTLRCAQQVPRSKRMLHSTFWNHGAGDLDLPPWMLSTHPMPPDLPLRHDSPPFGKYRRSDGAQADAQAKQSLGADGLFLDFLYPPQALATVQRANARQWHKWEKRNAKRLPEGFIVASRGYASQSHEEQALTGQNGPVEEVIEKNTQDEALVDSLNTFDKGLDAQREFVPSTQTRHISGSEHEEDLLMEPATSVENTVEEDETSIFEKFSPDGAFADSPADLAYGADATQRLRNVMMLSQSASTTSPQESAEYTRRAWSMYSSLSEKEKHDEALQADLVCWLSDQHNAFADSHCLKLYESMSESAKTMQVRLTALSVALRTGQLRLALRLQSDALKESEDGHRVSLKLFHHALQNRLWHVAIVTEEQHRLRYGHDKSGNESDHDLWKDVSNVAQLFSKCVDVAERFRRKQWKVAKRASTRTRRFYASLFKRAIWQELLRTDSPVHPASTRGKPPVPDPGKTRLLCNVIIRFEDRASTSRFFEQLLLAIYHPKASKLYAQLHRTASSIYFLYRTVSKNQLSVQLLTRLINRLTEFGGAFNNAPSTRRHLTIEDVVTDWQHAHPYLTLPAVKRLLLFYGENGHLKNYRRWLGYFSNVHGDVRDHRDIWWTQIYVHARRADPKSAQIAFEKVRETALECDEKPDIKCSGSLLYAHSRAEDLEGSLSTLQSMIDDSELPVDAIHFNMVLLILAKRGDADGAEDLLHQYDRVVGKPRNTTLASSLLLAYVRSDDIQTAEAILRETILQVQNSEISGSLLDCFNILMTAYATRRDIDATMGTYRWMKTEHVKPDGKTFANLILALAFYRRTDVAQKIVRSVMPANGVPPSAFHYSIVIAGYVNQRKYRRAIAIYRSMLSLNIEPTSTCKVAYFRAKTKDAQTNLPRNTGNADMPLNETIEKLINLIQDDTELEFNPNFGIPQLGGSSLAAHFDTLIFTFGQSRYIEAVRELYKRYKDNVEKQRGSQETPPIKLLASLMEAHRCAGEHDQVEECWRQIKQYADEFTPAIPVPTLGMKGMDATTSVDNDVDALDIQPLRKTEPNTQPRAELVNDTQPPKAPKPAPGRRFILTKPLRSYLVSLCSQSRHAEAIATFSKVLNQGYTLDNHGWNSFIQCLCGTTPPLALLAFVLTERFLISNFPGWTRSWRWKPGPQARSEGLQYIRARYLAPGELMPKYKTLVRLGAAFLDMRRVGALGRRGLGSNVEPELEKYVGNLREIRKRAPKTLFAVQRMPRVPDAVQRKAFGQT